MGKKSATVALQKRFWLGEEAKATKKENFFGERVTLYIEALSLMR